MIEIEDYHCRFEDIQTNLYQLDNVKQINYHQYIPNKTDNQWSIQAELFLRRNNPKVLAALFSRELWCFSINEDPLPELVFEIGGSKTLEPEKTGHFTPEFSKPNLPTPYAIFMKALRRMIYVNLSLSAKRSIISFGNSCIFQEERSNTTTILHLDPYLFENGKLTVAMCTKELNLLKLSDATFKPNTAIYLAPSGIRVYLSSSELKKSIVPPPKNAQMFLKTLLVSHGIDLLGYTTLTWVKLIPNTNHLNGFTPTISHYLDKTTGNNCIIWPMCLCFLQEAIDITSTKMLEKTLPRFELEDCFDMIDNFIQLKVTSAYRTPGAGAIGTATGINAMSSGGIFTDQFQGCHRSTESSHNNIPSTEGNGKYFPEYSPDPGITPLKTGRQMRSAFSGDSFNNGFITTPNINENITPTIDDMIMDHPSIKPQNDLWNERKVQVDHMVNQSPVYDSEGKDNSPRKESPANDIDIEENDQQTSVNVQEEIDFNKDLFGEESDEELSKEDAAETQHVVKEITDEMFDMAEDDEEIAGSHGSSEMVSEKISTPVSSSEQIKKTGTKRSYLDIPVDDITIPSTPALYEDPGAPLPVETPKDRKKSIYAPLNFNPIIESNVDKKYKNGGKFSFDPENSDEPLSFGISTANISSSEEEDSDYSPPEFNAQVSYSRKGMVTEGAKNNDGPVLITNSYEPITRDSLPELINPPTTKDEPSASSLLGGLNEKSIKTPQLEGIWKVSPSGKVSSQMNDKATLEDISGQVTPFISSNIPLYLDNTPSLPLETISPEAKKQQTPEDIFQPEATAKNSQSELTTELEETQQSDSSRILPYLLRHMPLFSIPDSFLSKNPALPPGKDQEEILDILTEQITFSSEIVCRFCTSSSKFQGVRDCKPGVVSNTLMSLFPDFSKVNGGEMIDEFFYLPEPSIYAKKAESTIKLKTTCNLFSPYLNLKPHKGVKNFRALFLTTEAKDECKHFISQISQMYSNQELGFCELTKLTNEDNKGLIYLKNLNQDTLLLLSAQIVSFCSTTTSNVKNFPLLIFLPIKESSLQELISIILKFHLIQKEVKSKLPKAELFLRLVSLDFLKDPLTPLNSYNSLCVSIYNSLPPKTIKFTSVANDLPRKVEIRAMNGASPLSIHYDNYIHLAYLRSIDREWLSASWCDANGEDSIVKTWYIGNSRTRFEQVCNEMWRITLKIASGKYGKLCLVLTRLDSVLPDEELVHWRRLSVGTKDLHLAVVCVGDNTKLSLFDENKTYPTFKNLFRDPKNEFKVSGDHIDDYEIVNLDEEVHGLVFSSPLQLANSQHRCAIKSGALVRFSPGDGDKFMDKFEVNLLNCPHSDSTTLLKTILEQYRNLAGLNSWFGVSSGKDNFIPWHVVAVRNIMNTMVHVKSSFEKESYIID